MMKMFEGKKGVVYVHISDEPPSFQMFAMSILASLGLDKNNDPSDRGLGSPLVLKALNQEKGGKWRPLLIVEADSCFTDEYLEELLLILKAWGDDKNWQTVLQFCLLYRQH